jgi:hypothetical protein
MGVWMEGLPDGLMGTESVPPLEKAPAQGRGKNQAASTVVRFWTNSVTRSWVALGILLTFLISFPHLRNGCI